MLLALLVRAASALTIYEPEAHRPCWTDGGEEPARLIDGVIWTCDPIQFEYRTGNVLPEAVIPIRAVARFLNEHPEIERVTVEVSLSWEGITPAECRALTPQAAFDVRAALRRLRVSGDRVLYGVACRDAPPPPPELTDPPMGSTVVFRVLDP